MIRYFIISGIKNAGKTTCIIQLYNYLKHFGYQEVAIETTLNNDIICLLYNPYGQKFVLINSASDNEDERQKLEKFIYNHNLFKDKKYSNLVIITALREWATGPYNCNIRVDYEKTLNLYHVRHSANLIDITIGIDTNNLHKAQVNSYFRSITNMAIYMISSAPFYL